MSELLYMQDFNVEDCGAEVTMCIIVVLAARPVVVEPYKSQTLQTLLRIVNQPAA